jgi:hypothetical protein
MSRLEALHRLALPAQPARVALLSFISVIAVAGWWWA